MCAKQLFIAVDRIDGDQRARAVFSRGGPGGTRELVGICIFHAGGSSARPDRQLSGKEGRKERRKRCRGSARWSVESVTRARGRSMRHRGY